MFVRSYVCMYVCMYCICMYISTPLVYACTYVCMYVCMYAFMYVRCMYETLCMYTVTAMKSGSPKEFLLYQLFLALTYLNLQSGQVSQVWISYVSVQMYRSVLFILTHTYTIHIHTRIYIHTYIHIHSYISTH